METRILVGTESGLWELRGDTVAPVEKFAAQEVTAIARDGARTWAIVGGRSLWVTSGDGAWEERAAVDGPVATCLAPTPDGLLVGTEQAHLLRFVTKGMPPVRCISIA